MARGQTHGRAALCHGSHTLLLAAAASETAQQLLALPRWVSTSVLVRVAAASTHDRHLLPILCTLSAASTILCHADDKKAANCQQSSLTEWCAFTGADLAWRRRRPSGAGHQAPGLLGTQPGDAAAGAGGAVPGRAGLLAAQVQN